MGVRLRVGLAIQPVGQIGGGLGMPQRKADALVKSVQALLAEREAVTAKERELVKTLNTVLNKMGYQVVPLSGSAAPARGRRRQAVRRAGRRPGRPAKARARRRGRRPAKT